MTRTKKRAIIVAVVAAVALAAAIGGYAYWTANGSGTASGTAASATTDLVLHGSFPTGIFPGGSEAVTFTADNPNSGPVRLGTISLASVTPDSGHSACPTTSADFTMAAVPVNADIAPGNGNAITLTGTLVYHNTTSDQSACKGATLTLNLTSN